MNCDMVRSYLTLIITGSCRATGWFFNVVVMLLDFLPKL